MNQNIVQIEEDQYNLSNIIGKIMNEKFTNAWKNQITKKYVQDTRDENYKDTEINIFLDENKKADNEKYRKGITLRKRIKEESELFRDTNLRYEEKIKKRKEDCRNSITLISCPNVSNHIEKVPKVLD